MAKGEKIVMVKVGLLVKDFSIYPRQHYGTRIDDAWVRELRMVIRSGQKFEHPCIAERKTNRLVDGFHRTDAMAKESGPEALIEVIYKTYKNDREALRESGRINSSHGKTMDRQDQIHYALKCEKLGMPSSEISDILAIPEEKLLHFLDRRTALNKGGEMMAIKNVVSNMAGKKFTTAQEEAHEHLGGSSQIFLVNQIISILKHGMTNTANARLMERLGDLQAKLGKFFRKNKAG